MARPDQTEVIQPRISFQHSESSLRDRRAGIDAMTKQRG